MREESPKPYRHALLVGLGVAALVCTIATPLVALVAPGPRPDPNAKILIRTGETLEAISQKLWNANVVRSPRLLRWAAALSGRDRAIKPGVYRFKGRLTLPAVLDVLGTGGEEKMVTVPEGLTTAQVAELLERQGLGSQEEFLELASDPVFVSSVGIRADNLEGYVFPDTYRLSEALTPREILALMVRRFHEVVDPEIQPRAAELGMTLGEVITLASIIEKETGDPNERPLVSAVFHNRLGLGIPLQSDPTVAYALGRAGAKLSRKDLAHPNAYNTYVRAGLPPGPIANPGLASIRAALNPASSKALFFVSRNDGTHEFSSTLAAHNRAVARYQLNQR